MTDGPEITATEIILRRAGMKLVAEVKQGTRLAFFRGKVFVAQPGQLLQFVNDSGELETVILTEGNLPQVLD